ncbi:MAG: sugar-binding protein, partial [Syntrophothermus sp.]
MKKQFTLLLLILSVVSYYSSVIYAQNKPKGQTIIGDVLQVPKTTDVPTIDGNMDDVWKNVTAVPLTLYEGATGDSIAGLKDHAANFRLMWDPKFLYLFVSVIDDSLYGGNVSSPWLNDCVEVFLDGANEKASSYDTNDVQWRWVYGETPANHPASSGKGEWVWKKSNLGYNFELRIPKDTLGAYAPLKDDQEIGFEISNGDAESAAGRDDVLHWWTRNGLTWNNPSLFGTAVLTANEVSSVMNINHTAQTPKIDGVKGSGEWDAANEISLNMIEGGDTSAAAVFAG